MIERVDIMLFMPEFVHIKVWEETYVAPLVDWKYVLNQNIDNPIEIDSVDIYVNDILFDTIEKRIALRAWDTLHLEYSLHVR